MVETDRTSSEDIPLTAVQQAVTKAQESAWQRQHDGGMWPSPGYLGPGTTAKAILALHFLGKLNEATKLGAKVLLERNQLSDGSFLRHPRATQGDLVTTAAAWAALRVSGLAEDDAAVQKARAFIEANGGLTRVAEDMYRLDTEGIFIAMVGMLDPKLLPSFPAELLLLPGVDHLVPKFMSAYSLWMFPAITAIARHLRGEPPAQLLPGAAQRSIEVIASCQNGNGSFNNVLDQTALGAAAFLALGLPPEDPRLAGATRWVASRVSQHLKPETPGSHRKPMTHVDGFPTVVWTTTYMLRALLASGVSRSDPRIAGAVRWLVSAQINDQRPPPLVPIPAGSPGTGGWAFEPTNTTTPDCDDTAVVLGGLGMALERDGSNALDDVTAGLAREAVQRGLAWMLPMQNTDGGWPAFQHGLAGKPPGPIFMEYPPFPKGIGLDDLRLLREPLSLMLGDPSTEDITARTLVGLAANGYTIQDPAVAKAIAFLKAQQCTAEHLGNAPQQGDGGPWWSRWMCNYLAATSFAMSGLATVGADLREPWIQRAISWLKRHQNSDGGWGEEASSYQDPRLAGIGTSTSALTGLVLIGLIQAGEGSSPEVARGIAYLLREQRDDGKWSSTDMLHVFLKVDTLYTLPAASLYYPLEALGRYLEWKRGGAVQVTRGDVNQASLERAAAGTGDGVDPSGAARDASGAWRDAFLEAMRQVGDPEADAVIQQIFAEGAPGAVNAVLEKIIRSDDPVPPGLPPRLMDYLDRTAVLPAWADPERIALGQRLFTRCGWTGALALFYSSLPQTYAVAKGVKVLLGTQGLTRHAERRIFETAQFVFDVMDEGAMSAKGRGIRAAQKTRLLHAAIRHLILQDASWDMTWGIPINQEDLALTLMTFSSVVLDAWKRLGLDLTASEAEAWQHGWNVVGHFLGIHPELLPRDVVDAAALMDTLRRLQWAPSPEGRELATALVAAIDRYLPSTGFAGLPVTAIRYLAGDHCGDVLGLPPADWTGIVLHALAAIESRVSHPDHDSVLRAVFNRLAFDLMKAIVLIERSGKQTRFRIPPALLHQWNLAD